MSQAATMSLHIAKPRLWGPRPAAAAASLRGGHAPDGARGACWTAMRRPSASARCASTRTPGPARQRPAREAAGRQQHHDLGALGAAFNVRAAERQTGDPAGHGQPTRCACPTTPPAPELLELADRMGVLVVDEIFDSWERKKTPLDFHLIFPDWHEADLRSMLRRDRNHPSVAHVEHRQRGGRAVHRQGRCLPSRGACTRSPARKTPPGPPRRR